MSNAFSRPVRSTRNAIPKGYRPKVAPAPTVGECCRDCQCWIWPTDHATGGVAMPTNCGRCGAARST